MSNVIQSGNLNRNDDDNSFTGSRSRRAKLTRVTIAIVAVVIIVAMIVSGIASLLFTLVTMPIVGFFGGAYSGLFVGCGAVGQFLSWVLLTPIALAGFLGALAGVIAAWLQRIFELKNKLGKSLISSSFSPEIWEGKATGLLSRLVVATIVGYAVAVGFSSIGIFGAGTSNLARMAAVVLGRGGGGGFEGEFISWLMFFFATLAALLVAGGIIGGSAGGVIGAIIGAGFSSIGVNAVIQGAVEGAMFRFFSHYRPNDLKSNWFTYLISGAGKGCGESIFTGAAVGMVLFITRLIGVIT